MKTGPEVRGVSISATGSPTCPIAWTKAVVKIFDVFDSPEHQFDSWATKRIGWPDLCHSKPFAKFKRNPKRNVVCGLNTRNLCRRGCLYGCRRWPCTIHRDTLITHVAYTYMLQIYVKNYTNFVIVSRWSNNAGPSLEWPWPLKLVIALPFLSLWMVMWPDIGQSNWHIWHWDKRPSLWPLYLLICSQMSWW